MEVSNKPLRGLLTRQARADSTEWGGCHLGPRAWHKAESFLYCGFLHLHLFLRQFFPFLFAFAAAALAALACDERKVVSLGSLRKRPRKGLF